MWRATAGQQVKKQQDTVANDDDWETDADFVVLFPLTEVLTLEEFSIYFVFSGLVVEYGVGNGTAMGLKVGAGLRTC